MNIFSSAIICVLLSTAAIICTPAPKKNKYSIKNGNTADGECTISDCKKGATALGLQKYKFELHRNWCVEPCRDGKEHNIYWTPDPTFPYACVKYNGYTSDDKIPTDVNYKYFHCGGDL
jgi:hypothetical protein